MNYWIINKFCHSFYSLLCLSCVTQIMTSCHNLIWLGVTKTKILAKIHKSVTMNTSRSEFQSPKQMLLWQRTVLMEFVFLCKFCIKKSFSCKMCFEWILENSILVQKNIKIKKVFFIKAKKKFKNPISWGQKISMKIRNFVSL